MKMKQAMMVLFSGALMMQAACIFGGEPGEPEPWNPSEPPVTEPPVEELAVLDVNYISGHLGNYGSCPEKGYSEGSSSSVGPSADFAPGDSAGACAPPDPDADVAEDYCGGGFLNCEEAQITLDLSNASADVIANGVQVKMIEVLDEDKMSRAILPINDVVVIADQMSFDGELGFAETVKVRVDYKGPVNLYEILADESADSRGVGYINGASLRITVGADNADDIVIETKTVYQIADVAT